MSACMLSVFLLNSVLFYIQVVPAMLALLSDILMVVPGRSLLRTSRG